MKGESLEYSQSITSRAQGWGEVEGRLEVGLKKERFRKDVGSADLLEGREEEIAWKERKHQEGEVSKSNAGPCTGEIQWSGCLLNPS